MDKFYDVIENYPREGVSFIDLSPLYRNPTWFRKVVNALSEVCSRQVVTKIVAIESRGYILGTALSQKMRLPLVLVRKKEKSPSPCYSFSSTKEYGTDELEIQYKDISFSNRCLVIDDIFATGGTLRAVNEAIESHFKAKVVGNVVIFNLKLPEAIAPKNLYSYYTYL